MTKEDITKALETCILGYCTGCPYDGCDGDCRDELHKDVLTLITEQEKEIERLDTDFITLECNYDKIYNEHKNHKIENENLKILNNKFRECIDYLKAEVKQSQIDVLNKVKERAVGLAANETYHICNLIDELIKEVENE